MDCCQCQGIEDLFDEKFVSGQLDDYRRKGPDKTTRILIDAIKQAGVAGLSLLDIGGGVGAVEHELIEAGIVHATDVDASSAYMQAARQEAIRRGIAGRIDFLWGNFVDLAKGIPPADIVTLDRVVCCYHDVANLVELSAARAVKLYGLVYPRDTWFARSGSRLLNLACRINHKPFRTFIHSSKRIDAIIRRHGLHPRFTTKTLLWQVVVYES